MVNKYPTTEEIIKELRDILKTYHYKSEEQHMSKDVVTSLENLLRYITYYDLDQLGYRCAVGKVWITSEVA